MATQVSNGKSFEFSLLMCLFEFLTEHHQLEVLIIKNEPYNFASRYFHGLDETVKHQFRTNAKRSIDLISNLEPRLVNSISENDIISLELVSDSIGQTGDVRDIIMVRSAQDWQIGISAKNNHRAVKHSRLSSSIDFGQKWFNVPCSGSYFEKVNPIFLELANLRSESKAKALWRNLEGYQTTVYQPILNAFKDEMIYLNEHSNGFIAKGLVHYLLGNQDFYKVINSKDSVEILAYNLNGTLNLPFNKVKPKMKMPLLKLPSKILDIDFKKDSLSTLNLVFDEGWQFSFRIHNASSRIEPSLKFDINLVGNPPTLFTQHLF